ISYNIVNFQYNYDYFLNISYNYKEIIIEVQDLNYYRLGEILVFDDSVSYDFKILFKFFRKIIEYDEGDLMDIQEIITLEKSIYDLFKSVLKTAIIRCDNENELIEDVTFYLTEFDSMHFYLFQS